MEEENRERAASSKTYISNSKPRKPKTKHPVPRARKTTRGSPPVEQPKYKTVVATKPDMLYISYKKLPTESKGSDPDKGEEEVEERDENVDEEQILKEKLSPMKFRFMSKKSREDKEDADLNAMVEKYLNRPVDLSIPKDCFLTPKYYLLDTGTCVGRPEEAANRRHEDSRKDTGEDVREYYKARCWAHQTLDEDEEDMYRIMVDQFQSPDVKEMPVRRRTPRLPKAKSARIVQKPRGAAQSLITEDTMSQNTERLYGKLEEQFWPSRKSN